MDELPNEIQNIIKHNTIFKPKNKDELQEAVDLWCDNKEEALNKYGYIKNWDTSLITDMRCLFYNKKKFNGNISNWDVSNVTHMCGMFWSAELFNKPLNNWDVSKVVKMEKMFCKASSFNQNINSWNTRNVRNIEEMFYKARKYNKPLDKWNVHNVKTNMRILDYTSYKYSLEKFGYIEA